MPAGSSVDAGSVLEVVGKVVKRLVEQDGIAPENIAVLTPSRSASALFVEELGGFATQTSGKIQAGRYVAMSRAVHHLIVVE